MAKIYRGKPEGPGWEHVVTVTVHDCGCIRSLPLYLDELNKSPTGFAWGYGGSGPAQLAYAILRDFTGDRSTAAQAFQEFKRDIIQALRPGPWTISGERIDVWLRARDYTGPWADLAAAGGLPEAAGRACPHCGAAHPPDGMCVNPPGGQP